MADVPGAVTDDPTEMLATGRRHLAVKDHSSAANCLAKACEVLASKHGQLADECGEAYFWYGKSLLGLAREESGVFGDGIPAGDDAQEDDEADDEGEEGNDADKKDSEDEAQPAEEGDAEVSGSTDVKVTMDVDNKRPETDAAASSSSASTSMPSSSADVETAENEEDDEIENLQLAWEVFELARDVFLKRGDRGKKELADVYLYLGEVSLESETYDKAISDMSKSLQLFTELYSKDDRRIAETHYQIGLAHSLSNGFDDAIEHFKKAAEILESRISNLQSNSASAEESAPQEKDQFYSVEGEIKELTELLPEIKEKVQDMMDYKAEAIRSVRETLGLGRPNGNSAPKENGSCSSSGTEKKASDISHLVKRKRTSDEVHSAGVSEPKRPAP